MNNTTLDKIPLKCYCIDGSVLEGFGESLRYSFALDEAPSFKTFSRPEITIYKKKNENCFDKYSILRKREWRTRGGFDWWIFWILLY